MAPTRHSRPPCLPTSRSPGAVKRRPPVRMLAVTACIALLLAFAIAFSLTVSAHAAVNAPNAVSAQRAAVPERGGSSLEAAATKAGNTGRAVAMSLIGLAFAIAATVLAFRRDFKEAAGVFAVGLVAILLATPAGMSLLRDTVASVFGSQ
jgi:uncharacterized membrane protein